MKKIFSYSFLLLAICFSLQGCFFVAGAAAGAAAVSVIYDHRTFQKIIDDTQIANRISNQLSKVPAIKNDSHIDVTVFNRVALLTGETPNTDTRAQAEEIAQSTSGVTRVYNQISIENPTSSLTRTSDAWITAKIKSRMLATEDLKSSTIKVVTENGTVYLMGMVSRDQADIAVDIAREVSGVQKVVKIFQIT